MGTGSEGCGGQDVKGRYGMMTLEPTRRSLLFMMVDSTTLWRGMEAAFKRMTSLDTASGREQ